jgi:hypothetical protein
LYGISKPELMSRADNALVGKGHESAGRHYGGKFEMWKQDAVEDLFASVRPGGSCFSQ